MNTSRLATLAALATMSAAESGRVSSAPRAKQYYDPGQTPLPASKRPVSHTRKLAKVTRQIFRQAVRDGECPVCRFPFIKMLGAGHVRAHLESHIEQPEEADDNA